MAKKKQKRKLLDRIDQKTDHLSGGIVRTVRRIQKSVRSLDRNLNKIGNAVERLYDAQSKAGL
ncbi:MAG: hypothetical protein R2941_17375 [Desulfobacterales bacterium]